METNCKDRVRPHLDGRLEDLKILWKDYQDGSEEGNEELGNIFDYGLCFDWVSAHTFTDQKEGFFRYQLSTGGPGDEFRFYVNPDFSVHTIEYLFLDWNDGASIELDGKEYELNVFFFSQH